MDENFLERLAQLNIEHLDITDIDDEGNEDIKTFDVDVLNLADDFDSELEVVEVSMDDLENNKLVCPYSGSSDIYRLAEGIYAAFDVEKPFIVKIKED